MNNYDDIIDLPHHISKTRARMSMELRASQFAPFSALTGYEDAVKEKGRLTVKKIEIDEEMENILNNKLDILEANIKDKPEVMVTYFIKDMKKDGGKYVEERFVLRRIDKVNKELVMTNGKVIKFYDLIDINSDLISKCISRYNI